MRPFLPFQGDITMKHDAELFTVLRHAHAALSSIAAVTCYEDDLPVTALESREIEDIFTIATAHLEHIKAVLAHASAPS